MSPQQTRTEYCRVLEQTCPNHIIPLIVRARFDNPNAVLDDLNQDLDHSRERICSRLSTVDPPPKRLIIILLSHAPLQIPQLASPGNLPEWVPFFGGKLLECLIRDIETTAEGPLSAPEARVPNISEALFDLDGQLLRRLQLVHSRTPPKAQAFFEKIRDLGPNDETYEMFLDGAARCHEAVAQPESYRPSRRSGQDDAVVERLWTLADRTAPASLGKAAKALSQALDLEDQPLPEEHLLGTILLRTADYPNESLAIRLARNIVVTDWHAAQFITIAAHSDAYPQYSLQLLQATSLDIRRSCTGMAGVLRSLP
jgi:hypothetical protein